MISLEEIIQMIGIGLVLITIPIHILCKAINPEKENID
jgi:hypothetical protein